MERVVRQPGHRSYMRQCHVSCLGSRLDIDNLREQIEPKQYFVLPSTQ